MIASWWSGRRNRGAEQCAHHPGEQPMHRLGG
jgi:hypothetical protein